MISAPAGSPAATARESLAFFLVFAIVVFVADFLFVAIDPVPPLLADDWAIHAELVWGQTRPAATRLREIFLMSWEGRPLRVLEYGLQIGAYRLVGLSGAFLVQALVLALAALAFARIVRRRFPRDLAFFAGLIFLLHPGDTTHAWLATMMAKLGLLYALLAILAFARGRNILAFLLLMAGFLSYELSPFAFALAPWAADGMSRRSIGRALKVFGAALLTYALWRLVAFAAVAPDVRGALTAPGESGAAAVLGRSLAGLVAVFPAMLVPAFVRDGALLGRALLVTIALLPLALGARLLARRARGDEEPRPCLPRGEAARAAGAGVFGMMAGAALSFAAAPTVEAGIASRHLIAALPGTALLFTAALAGLGNLFGGRRGAGWLRFGLGLALLGIGATARHAIQSDYREAGAEQRARLRGMIETLGPLPPQTLVIIRHPLLNWPRSGRAAEERAMAPLVTGFGHEIEAILGLVYDRSIVGIALESERDLVRSQLATASQILAETRPFHAIVAYDTVDRSQIWVKRPPLDPGERLIAPGGPAFDYLGR